MADEFCTSCGAKLRRAAAFCVSCGQPTPTAVTAEVPTVLPAAPAAPPNRRSLYMSGAVLAALLVGGVAFGMNKSRAPVATDSNPVAQAAVPAPIRSSTQAGSAATAVSAASVSGAWSGNWHNVKSGSNSSFTMYLNQSADGIVSGDLVGASRPVPMRYRVAGRWEGPTLVLNGSEWIHQTEGSFLDHMVFTSATETSMSGTYARTSDPNTVRGTITMVRT